MGQAETTYKYINHNGKTAREHRVVMENLLGRKLDEDEVVHHINENKQDNRIENLQIMSRSEHTHDHLSGTTDTKTINCYCCGKELIKETRLIKYRDKTGQTKFYCSHACSAIANSTYFEKYGNISELIKEELNNGLTGYAIAKKYGLNRKTVYNNINKL